MTYINEQMKISFFRQRHVLYVTYMKNDLLSYFQLKYRLDFYLHNI